MTPFWYYTQWLLSFRWSTQIPYLWEPILFFSRATIGYLPSGKLFGLCVQSSSSISQSKWQQNRPIEISPAALFSSNIGAFVAGGGFSVEASAVLWRLENGGEWQTTLTLSDNTTNDSDLKREYSCMRINSVGEPETWSRRSQGQRLSYLFVGLVQPKRRKVLPKIIAAVGF